MSAERTAIRQAAVAKLIAAVPAFGGRVFSQRVIPLSERQMPAAIVFTAGETITLISESPKDHRRTVRLVIHIIAESHGEIEDVLDELAAQVEQAIYQDEQLDGTAVDVTLVGIEGPDISEDGSRLSGVLRVVWEALYTTEVSEAPEPTQDVDLVHVEIESHAARTGPEMEAEIELEVATP